MTPLIAFVQSQPFGSITPFITGVLLNGRILDYCVAFDAAKGEAIVCEVQWDAGRIAAGLPLELIPDPADPTGYRTCTVRGEIVAVAPGSDTIARSSGDYEAWCDSCGLTHRPSMGCYGC